MSFAESDLILGPENRLYHINLVNENIADDVILMGDPGRVEQVSRHFSSVDFKSAHREFICHTGFFREKKLTVLSTGIGTDNIDIVLNELDAAVNIDPSTRALRQNRRRLNLYRLGTTGSLQKDVEVNSIVFSSRAIGLDCLMNYYHHSASISDQHLSRAFMSHCHWPATLPQPLCFSASSELSPRFQCFINGITVTAPGFYGPQGRQLRLEPLLKTLNESLAAFRYGDERILNFEMETSALYGLAELLGHRAATICVVIANRPAGTFAASYRQSVEHLILSTLNKICN